MRLLQFIASTVLLPNNLISTAMAAFPCPVDDSCFEGCHYPGHNSCDKFMYCDWHGKAVIQYCPNGLQFNEEIRACDWPPSPTCRRVVNQVIDIVEAALPPDGGIVDNTFSCGIAKESQGCMGHNIALECIYTNPKSSTSYIQCTEGVPYAVQCPDGQVYKDEIKACVRITPGGY
jgi:hypothetical protein